tara:strand:- start:97 stop:846 length:750 start_codon:yes stop_codon:yes gene_type:complete
MYYILLVGITIFIIIYLVYNKKYFNNNNNIKINKTFVINLDSRKDRLKSIDKDLKKIKLEYERFPACDGKKLDKYSNDISKYFDKNNKLTPGQIGCSLSHIKIWEKAIKDNNKYTLVLEDDAIIPPNFWKKINNLLLELPLNYNMILLGCCSCEGEVINNKNYILKGSKNPNSNWCTTAYIINHNFCKKLINIIKNNKLKNKSIDRYLNTNIYPNYDFYINNLPFIKQNKKFDSDIIMGELGNTIKIIY